MPCILFDFIIRSKKSRKLRRSLMFNSRKTINQAMFIRKSIRSYRNCLCLFTLKIVHRPWLAPRIRKIQIREKKAINLF